MSSNVGSLINKVIASISSNEENRLAGCLAIKALNAAVKIR